MNYTCHFRRDCDYSLKKQILELVVDGVHLADEGVRTD
jgi:hypothetical protein